MADRKHILLYFGSFNPIHIAHVAIAEYAIEKGVADEVVFIVSPANPLKDPKTLASEYHRFEMAELAVAASKYPDTILVSLVEMTLPRPSYTINTLRFLSEQFADVKFSILMGSDNISQFDKWKESEQILNNYDIYVYPRAGEKSDKYPARVTLLEDAPLFKVSSTDIRERLCRGEEIGGKVAEEVAEYIKKHELWQHKSI